MIMHLRIKTIINIKLRWLRIWMYAKSIHGLCVDSQHFIVFIRENILTKRMCKGRKDVRLSGHCYARYF